MTNWTVDPVGGPWFFVALAAALLPLLAIGPRQRRLTSRQRRWLVGLRIASLAMLLLILARPALETITYRQQPATVVVLADRSRSMTVEDGLNGRSRWDAMRESLGEAASALATLDEQWDLHCYTFADSLEPVDVDAGRLQLAAEANGGQTAIGASLEEVLDRESQQRVLAVVLLSDGAQRAFAPRDLPPQTGVQRLATDGTALLAFTYGEPALATQSDLRISDLIANQVVFADTPMTVEATLTAMGYANQEAQVRLLWETHDGSLAPVDTRTFPHRRAAQKLSPAPDHDTPRTWGIQTECAS